MAKEKKQIPIEERWKKDSGVAFFDPKKKKWVTVSDGDDNGEEVAPQKSNTDEIEEI